MFFYLCKVLFSGLLQFNGNFVDAQNSLKYRERAPLNFWGHFLDTYDFYPHAPTTHDPRRLAILQYKVVSH